MVDLTAIDIDSKALNLIPRQSAIELSVLPLYFENDLLVVAASENSERQLAFDLAFLFGKRVKVEPVPLDLLESAIRLHYGKSEGRLRVDTFSESCRSLSRQIEIQNEPTGNGSVVSLVNRMITDAVQMKASDIHIEPMERNMRIRFRLDGVLYEMYRPPLEKAKPLISRLKVMADLDIAEKRRPQDGRIRVKEGERVVDIRVSTLPTDFGEKIVLRILDKSQLCLDMSKLGFEEHDLCVFQKTISLPYGMILVTGPTGSGKTTTLYAALNHLNKTETNITTIEDPIEYHLAGINQTHARPEIGLGFAAVLRSILRQDPNVIMVGEIRDHETAEIAVRAALTGHLVFSTLHTNDAPSAITRLIEMGIEPFLVASSVKLIVTQRLVRTLCNSCKYPVEPSTEQTRELHLDKDRGIRFESADGCELCNNSGYQGRTAVFEVFEISNGAGELIVGKQAASELRRIARKSGLVTLREAALKKARRGETSLFEVMKETMS